MKFLRRHHFLQHIQRKVPSPRPQSEICMRRGNLRGSSNIYHWKLYLLGEAPTRCSVNGILTPITRSLPACILSLCSLERKVVWAKIQVLSLFLTSYCLETIEMVRTEGLTSPLHGLLRGTHSALLRLYIDHCNPNKSLKVEGCRQSRAA